MMGRAFGYGHENFQCGNIPIFLILLVGAVILFFVLRSRRNRYTELHNGTQAVSILNERLAKGEITQEEYEMIKKLISN